MTPRHGADDLLLFALGQLDAAAADAVRARIARSPTVAADLDRIRRHLALYDVLAHGHAAAPAPPPVERVLSALPARQAARGPRRSAGPAARRRVLAAAALVLVTVGGLALWAAGRGAEPPPVPEARTRGAWERTASGGAPAVLTLGGLDPGQVDVAWPGFARDGRRVPARRARLVAAPGTRLALASDASGPARVDLERGRLWIDVPPVPGAPRLLVVDTPGGTVEVVGTLFEVAYDGATGLAVRVARGAVRVGGQVLDAGASWPAGASSSGFERPAWLPVPTVTLAAAAGPPDAETVHLDVRGPGTVDLDLPPLGGDGHGAWLEWVDPEGSVLRSVPVRGANVVEGPKGWLEGDPQALAAGARLRLTLRFGRPPGLPPAYRLRALLRPAGTAPWLSPALDRTTPTVEKPR